MLAITSGPQVKTGYGGGWSSFADVDARLKAAILDLQACSVLPRRSISGPGVLRLRLYLGLRLALHDLPRPL